VIYQLAGITVEFKTDLPIVQYLREAFRPFLVDELKPDLSYRLHWFDPDLLVLPPITDEQRESLKIIPGFHPSRWYNSPLLRTREVRQSVEACLERPDLAHVDLRLRRAIIHNFHRSDVQSLYPSQNEIFFGYSSQNKGQHPEAVTIPPHRNRVAPMLVNFSALILHCSGVVSNGLAALFLASDGGGKSTVLKDFPGQLVLNDDRVILRRAASRIIAHSTPFGRIYNGPQQAPLGSLFLLEKASRFEIIPIPPSEVIKHIWDEHYLIWGILPKALRTRAFELVCDACKQAVTYRLRFSKDGVDWRAIEAAMSK